MSENKEFPIAKDEKWTKTKERESSLQGDNSIEMNWELNDENIREFNDIYPENQIQLPNVQSNQGNTPSQLFKLHQRFKHVSYAKLQIMARKGIIPRKYASCEIPICQACAYAKIIRRPWRNKPKADGIIQDDMKPGDVTSVDQLVSPVPGFIAQMTGKLTVKRYKYATVFVDQASKVGYVHL